MSRSMTATAQSTRSNSLDSIRPQQAKADLPINASQSGLNDLIPEALRRSGCSQKEAAFEMGIDPAQFTRQMQNGHLTAERIDRLPVRAKAELAKLMTEEYGALATPAARLRIKARELRDIAAELDQAAEWVA